MNRRQFCRTAVVVGGTVVFAPLVQACGRFEGTALPGPTATSFSNPTAAPRMTEPALQNATTTTAPIPTATMRATEDSTMANVALIKTADRADGVRRAIELLGLNPVSGKSILLKPNFNSAHPAPGSTHPDVLRTLIGELNGMGARAITVADRSGMGDTRAVMQQIGVHDLAKELGFDAVSFDELPATDWVVRESKDFHWRRGYAVPKMLLDAECVVQTCNLKTHRFGGHFTLSLKNSVGLAAKTVEGGSDYRNELRGSPHQRHVIVKPKARRRLACSSCISRAGGNYPVPFNVSAGTRSPRMRLATGMARSSSRDISMNLLASSISTPMTRLCSSKSSTTPGATSSDSPLVPSASLI